MNLHGHDMQAEDVQACATLLETRYPHEGFDLDLVLKHFPVWLSHGSLKGCVVEGPTGALCFGASVFITGLFADHLLAEPSRRVGAEIVRASQSANSPIWEPPGRARPSLGLNILIIHSGFAPSECDEETTLRAKALMMHGFLSLYNGYDVQRIFVEAFNERDRRFYSGSAFLEIAPSGGSTASYLLVLTRERVLSLDIHPLLPIFTNAASKYRFSFGEQSLLARALEGHTDEELAQLLSLSLSAIKKRWVKIFERVDSALPELSDGRCHGQKRGAQKRHLLLRYLRNHPEELRSFSRSRK